MVFQTERQALIEMRKRLRELGIKTGYLPVGKKNTICDVAGLRVGHSTIIEGDGALVRGQGPKRTGVTVIIPHADDLWSSRPSGAFYSLNGCGVVLGSDWINESGALEGPIALTNSHSVFDVGKALTNIMVDRFPAIGTTDDAYLPVVGECDDSPLNDINGYHVKEEHVRKAFENASDDVTEGAVGAGTGMTCYGFKGGIGTASRLVSIQDKTYTVGVLVNTNHGQTHQLLINGNPVGLRLKEESLGKANDEGSIVMLVATDAPFNHQQLERICKRACMGLARTGSSAGNGSGDFVIAFSTGRRVPRQNKSAILTLPEIHSDHIGGFFEATVEATEEAILNSIFVADSMTGRDGFTSPALPVSRCLELLQEK